MPEQAWQRAAPRSGHLSGMIKRVNRYEPHVLQIDSSAWRSRSFFTSPGPPRTADQARSAAHAAVTFSDQVDRFRAASDCRQRADFDDRQHAGASADRLVRLGGQSVSTGNTEVTCAYPVECGAAECPLDTQRNGPAGRGTHKANPGRAGERAPDGADGSAGELADSDDG
jgi:hypothetical protein